MLKGQGYRIQPEVTVTRASLREYAAKQRERYQDATRTEKPRLLDKVVADDRQPLLDSKAVPRGYSFLVRLCHETPFRMSRDILSRGSHS